MKVSIIDERGEVRLRNVECDMKTYDGDYYKINGELLHKGYVFKAEHTEEVSKAIMQAWNKLQIAQRDHMTVLMEMGNKFRARQ